MCSNDIRVWTEAAMALSGVSYDIWEGAPAKGTGRSTLMETLSGKIATTLTPSNRVTAKCAVLRTTRALCECYERHVGVRKEAIGFLSGPSYLKNVLALIVDVMPFVREQAFMALIWMCPPFQQDIKLTIVPELCRHLYRNLLSAESYSPQLLRMALYIQNVFLNDLDSLVKPNHYVVPDYVINSQRSASDLTDADSLGEPTKPLLNPSALNVLLQEIYNRVLVNKRLLPVAMELALLYCLAVPSPSPSECKTVHNILNISLDYGKSGMRQLLIGFRVVIDLSCKLQSRTCVPSVLAEYMAINMTKIIQTLYPPAPVESSEIELLDLEDSTDASPIQPLYLDTIAWMVHNLCFTDEQTTRSATALTLFAVMGTDQNVMQTVTNHLRRSMRPECEAFISLLSRMSSARQRFNQTTANGSISADTMSNDDISKLGDMHAELYYACAALLPVNRGFLPLGVGSTDYIKRYYLKK